MRVLFLDIDGVLNSARWFAERRKLHEDGEVVLAAPPGVAAIDGGVRSWHELDPGAIPRLQRLLDATGAVVVLSSAWRLIHTLDEMRTLLGSRGLRCELIDRTPDLADRQNDAGLWVPTERGDEIAAWLEEHPEVSAYVVLDDGHDMTAVAERFVATTWAEGLLDEHVDRAIALLGGA